MPITRRSSSGEERSGSDRSEQTGTRLAWGRAIKRRPVGPPQAVIDHRQIVLQRWAQARPGVRCGKSRRAWGTACRGATRPFGGRGTASRLSPGCSARRRPARRSGVLGGVSWSQAVGVVLRIDALEDGPEKLTSGPCRFTAINGSVIANNTTNHQFAAEVGISCPVPFEPGGLARAQRRSLRRY
jgi:hypothetical protein